MRKQKLVELKNEYMNINIPDELQLTVQNALEEGKRMSKRRNSWIKWAGIAAVMVLVFTASCNMNPAAARALSDIPIVKNIISVLTFREYQVNDDTFHADIKTPAVIGLDNHVLQDSLNAKYLKENQELYKEFISDMGDIKAIGEGHLGVESGYEIKTDNDKILSISRWVVNTVGSSSTTKKFDTIDKQREILITLPSLFQDNSYIEVISENIKQQMREQMKNDSDKTYWVTGTDQELFMEPFTSIARDQSFYINNDGKLVISFDKYEVAPGYMGVVEFIIPTEVISDLLVSNEYIK